MDNALLDGLEACASAPLELARALPAPCYWDAGFYDLEVDRIFTREWMCVARAEQLPQPGDWLAVDLVGEPIVLTRDPRGEHHALSRVCPHRSMDVLASDGDRGRAERFVCPYHRWSFRTDGTCIGATDMDGSIAFSKDACRLGEFALATWQGFVFVNLAPDPPPLAPAVAGLDDVLGAVDLSTWVTARTLDWGELPVSWKVVIENGAECYHHLGAHRETLEPVYPHASVDVQLSDDDHWIGGYMGISREFSAGHGPDGSPLHPLFFDEPGPGISSVQRASTLIAGIFPMFFFAMSPDFVTWFRWLPTGPESHRVDLNIVIPPAAAAQPDREQVLDEIEAVLRAIQDEDVATTSAVQRSLRSRHAGGGPLSPLEYPLWRFQRYLASRLLGTPGG